MTIQEMNNTLDEMRKIYRFDDAKTQIQLRDVCTMTDSRVAISTIDEPTGIQIEMAKRPERKV